MFVFYFSSSKHSFPLARKEKEKWLTKKGFRYPAQKTKAEMMTHAKKPPAAVIEELSQPWCPILREGGREGG